MASLGFQLIQNLSIQRQGLVEVLELIKQADLDSVDGYNLLASLQVRVLFHLRVEDELLVAILDREAKHSLSIARAVEQWTPQLRGCANQAQAFFQKWLDPRIHTRGVRGEWQPLEELLEHRMEASERLLYPAYKSVQSEKQRKTRAAPKLESSRVRPKVRKQAGSRKT